LSAPRATVVISGATGFLGSALLHSLAARGHRLRALARNPAAAPAAPSGTTWHACVLPDRVDDDAFAGADAFVHCAFYTRFRDTAEARAVNVEGSARLFRVCRAQGVSKIVFISSMSAHEDAVSVYGRTKLAVEALLDPQRDVALRPGHIIGEGGIFWRTARSIAALPFIPVFYGGRQVVQTVALDDVCEAVRAAVETNLAGNYCVAEPVPVTLREFYAAIAGALGKRPRFLPLPGDLTVLALSLAEHLGFQLPLSSDNLRGLKRLRTFDVEDDLRRIGLDPRPMRESLARIRWEELS
jgi:nucleoside-diphosphate-sugar epimerase